MSTTVLIGSDPFNSGNEFHRTILIRAIVRVCSSSPRRGLEQREVGCSCSQFNDRGGDPREFARVITPRPPLSPTCRISRSSSLVPTWRIEREKVDRSLGTRWLGDFIRSRSGAGGTIGGRIFQFFQSIFLFYRVSRDCN